MNDRLEKAREKLKLLQERKLKLESRYQVEAAKLKELERKNRTKKLIQIGGLAEKAGIADYPPEVLLGAMIQVSYLLQDRENALVLAEKGKAAINS